VKISGTWAGIGAAGVLFIVMASYANSQLSITTHPIQHLGIANESQVELGTNPISQVNHVNNSTPTVASSMPKITTTGFPEGNGSHLAVPAFDESRFPVAPQFEGISDYINSGPINLDGLRGKVVLIDFWTIDCINCAHTMPYLTSWYSKYSSKGLAIIGVHTPEFSFEKDKSTVQQGVNGFGIKFPVLLDNNYQTWDAYSNHYWPHMYLVDSSGHIRYDHIGEGAYDSTENMIQILLKELPIQSS
jgi:thiol-disulfide isomerase/thioredoxin